MNSHGEGQSAIIARHVVVAYLLRCCRRIAFGEVTAVARLRKGGSECADIRNSSDCFSWFIVGLYYEESVLTGLAYIVYT
jgi:hypothetical protein